VAEQDTVAAPPVSAISDQDIVQPPPASSSTSLGRQLPRFGPPPEEVIIGLPLSLNQDAAPPSEPEADVQRFVPELAEQFTQPEDVAETLSSAEEMAVDVAADEVPANEMATPVGEPEADASAETEATLAALQDDEPLSTPEPSSATVPRSGRWDDVTLFNVIPLPAVVEVVAASPATAIEADVSASATPDEAISDFVTADVKPVEAESVEAANAIAFADEDENVAAHASQEDASSQDDGVATLATAQSMQQGMDLADAPSAAFSDDAPDADASMLAPDATDDAPPTEPTGEAAVDVMAMPDEEVTSEPEAALMSENLSGESEAAPVVEADDPAPGVMADDPPTVSAIERMHGVAASPQQPPTGGMGSTSVLASTARTDYMSRHRPPWLDAGDVGSIPGVQIDLSVAPEDDTVVLAPTAPASGALTLPAHDVAPANDATADAAPADMADLADLTAPPTDDAADAPDSPADSQASAKRLRTPSRPMPKLERDIIDPPHER
jgi:hypothetical protein